MPDPTSPWDLEDPDDAADRYRRAIRGATPRDAQLLMTHLARSVARQGRPDDGLGLLEATTPVDAEVEARIHLERARILDGQGATDQARADLREAVRASEGLDALHVEALLALADLVPAPERDELHERALRVARASDDLRARDQDADVLQRIGLAHAEAGEWPDALAALEGAWGARERQGDVVLTRQDRWAVAWAMRHLDRPFDALLMQRSLRAELEAIGEAHPHVDEEIALLEALLPDR